MLPINGRHLIRRHHNREQLARLPLPPERHLFLPQRLPLRSGAVIQTHTRRGQPLPNLQHPIREGRKRRNDQEGSIDPFLTQEGEKRDDLDGLAQALQEGGRKGGREGRMSE